MMVNASKFSVQWHVPHADLHSLHREHSHRNRRCERQAVYFIDLLTATRRFHLLLATAERANARALQLNIEPLTIDL